MRVKVPVCLSSGFNVGVLGGGWMVRGSKAKGLSQIKASVPM